MNDEIAELTRRAEKAERERDAAIAALFTQATLRGRAEGALEASEMAGVVDGWRRRAERAEAALTEMTRRRDEWKKKAEGYDAVRLALREKVGSP